MEIVLIIICCFILGGNIITYHKTHESFELISALVSLLIIMGVIIVTIKSNYEKEVEKIKTNTSTKIYYKIDTVSCKRIIKYKNNNDTIPVDTTYILIKNKK